MDELTEYVPLETIGALADRHAEQRSFTAYQETRAENTRARQAADIKLFCMYLAEVSLKKEPEKLLSDPLEWKGITWGIVGGFRGWQLLKGYAIGSINVRISTIKKYCELATAAGVLSTDDLLKIRLVKSYRYKEGRNIDKGRDVTRVGHKKAAAVALTTEHVNRLKNEQPYTPQGTRDAFLLCLLFDHALRRNEVALLTLDSLNLETARLLIYREKTQDGQIHELSPDTYKAARRYFDLCRPGDSRINPERHLVMGGNNRGEIFGAMSDRAIAKRFNVLCRRIGVNGASPHDGRHYCATALAAGGTDTKTMMEMCNWKSPSVALGYINAQTIANKGAKFGEVK
jgi:integrase